MNTDPNSEDDTGPEEGVGGDELASEVQGEGDHPAARRVQWKEREFVRDEALVKKSAREAADALDGPEGEELERARLATDAGRAS